MKCPKCNKEMILDLKSVMFGQKGSRATIIEICPFCERKNKFGDTSSTSRWDLKSNKH